MFWKKYLVVILFEMISYFSFVNIMITLEQKTKILGFERIEIKILIYYNIFVS